MKKLTFTFIILFAINLTLSSQVDKIAKEILTAYKNKDVELLKKNASGIIKMTITPSYFEDPSIKENMKLVDGWNGEIKEIRYEEGDVMGRKVIMAYAYFADIPGTEEISIVFLSSTDKKNWVMFANGIDKVEKSKFEALSKDLSTNEAKSEKKASKHCNIEMANGEIYENVTMEKMVSCFDTLDDDNFFITMTCKDDFIQAAVSDNGFVVEYNEKGIHYAATKVIPKNQTIELFKKYYESQPDWNASVSWEKN
ncbi:MAG TPA: hypothetical protein P5132_07955 [Bacteroidales bacterium]|nr:hypothetical protein [Bacteroidales bacterium]